MPTSRTSRFTVLTLVGAVVATVAVATPASAATPRHASPGGSGTTCSADAPCAIDQALFGTSAGDDVIVEPGDYVVTGNVDVPVGVTFHGAAGAPRPHLLLTKGTVVLRKDALLRHVEIEEPTSNAALHSLAGKVDQVVIGGTGGAPCTAILQDTTIRNSIVVASGGSGSAACTSGIGATVTSSYRNVTAIATGSGGAAIEARATNMGKASIELVNVIAKGGPGAGVSFDFNTDSSGAEAKITATHTNWANSRTSGTNTAYLDGGGNQNAPPAFVDAAAGNYHQAPGSVTIGGGIDEPINGAFDLDGDPRAIGKTDIGADELVLAPAATTAGASAVTDQSATVSGSADPMGAPTTYHFEYGTTTAYGETTPPVGAGSGIGAIPAGATLVGLAPDTTYHFRSVATNAGGVAHGADQTFTTGSQAPTPPPGGDPTAPAQPPAAQRFAGVKLLTTRLAAVRGIITLKLECPAATVGHCSGRTKLTTRRRRATGGVSTVTLGRAPFSIAPGSRVRVKIRVSRAGRRLLGRASRLRGKSTSVATSETGDARTTAAAVTIRRRTR